MWYLLLQPPKLCFLYLSWLLLVVVAIWPLVDIATAEVSQAPFVSTVLYRRCVVVSIRLDFVVRRLRSRRPRLARLGGEFTWGRSGNAPPHLPLIPPLPSHRPSTTRCQLVAALPHFLLYSCLIIYTIIPTKSIVLPACRTCQYLYSGQAAIRHPPHPPMDAYTAMCLLALGKWYK